MGVGERLLVNCEEGYFGLAEIVHVLVITWFLPAVLLSSRDENIDQENTVLTSDGMLFVSASR